MAEHENDPAGSPRGGPSPGRELPAGPITLVILGASGDLTSRLLLPGLATLIAARGTLDITLIGAARADLGADGWQDLIRSVFTEHGVPQEQTRDAVSKARWLTTDATDADDLQQVLEAAVPEAPCILYFALPPAVTQRACRVLEDLELPGDLRLALEKPFGGDLDSARALNAQLTRVVDEDQVFRVDHFLGESMVLNLLTVQTANRILRGVWDRDHVESVEIVYDESLALEGRAGYYDSAGALIDMHQSHLLQMLAFVAMDTPASIDQRDLRAQIAAVLRATRVADGDPVASSRRARYGAGSIEGRDIPAYADEDGVDPSRGTETLAELDLVVATERWHGVPFRLRSGKALRPENKQVKLRFRRPDFLPTGLAEPDQPDQLIISLEPETVSLSASVDGAATPFRVSQQLLTAQLGTSDIEPYGEVLATILAGDPLLSVRADAAEESWRIIDPVLAAWRRDDVPLEEYPAGSEGPWPRD